MATFTKIIISSNFFSYSYRLEGSGWAHHISYIPNNCVNTLNVHIPVWLESSMRNFIAYQLTPSCLCSVRLWGGTSQYKNSGWSECPSWVMALAGERTLSIISYLWRHPHQWPVGAHSSSLHYKVRYTLCFILYFTFLPEAYVGTLCYKFSILETKIQTSKKPNISERLKKQVKHVN